MAQLVGRYYCVALDGNEIEITSYCDGARVVVIGKSHWDDGQVIVDRVLRSGPRAALAAAKVLGSRDGPRSAAFHPKDRDPADQSGPKPWSFTA